MSPSLRLRPVQPSDLPAFYAHHREPEAVRMADFPPRDQPAFTLHWAKILRDGSIAKQTILVDGEVAGHLVCYGPPEERLIGYWLAHEHWGRGIATRALAAFLEDIRERPLYAHVAKINPASIRVLEKCGFERTDSADPEEIKMTLP